MRQAPNPSASPARNATRSRIRACTRRREWPAVVARMQRNMEWMNRVVGSKPVPGEPQLQIEAINAFLIRHARR
jgi:hypothetical protein